ncbi:MAG TPA: hypothetical protein ENN17_10950 [bacterium]|nr:hypothetical protein [bacterium]
MTTPIRCVLVAVFLQAPGLDANGLVLRAGGGYAVPLLDNARFWSPGGPKAVFSTERMFDSGSGVGFDLEYTFWRRGDETGYAKSRSFMHRFPATVSLLIPLTGAGVFEGSDNQLFWRFACGVEMRILHWMLDWGYDVFRESDWKIHPRIYTGFRFEIRGEGGGYFVETGPAYVFSRIARGYRDLTFSVTGGLMWF